MDFVTQICIDATRDEGMRDMCVAMGLTQVFAGIETPNVESLRETGKRQNLRINLIDEVQKLVDHGISVMGGMIIGFDHDGPGVFAQQYEFAMATSEPMFGLGALERFPIGWNHPIDKKSLQHQKAGASSDRKSLSTFSELALMASEATPLDDRIIREGRLLLGEPRVQAAPWCSNIAPVTMSMRELNAGMQKLCNALYAPAAFGQRLLRFVDTFGCAARSGAPIAPVDYEKWRDIDKQISPR